MYFHFDCEANENAAKYFGFRIRCWTPNWTRTSDCLRLSRGLQSAQFDEAIKVFVLKYSTSYTLSFLFMYLVGSWCC